MQLFTLFFLTYARLAHCGLEKNAVYKLDGRIVGGKPTDIKQHPWQISLQRFNMHVCGGCIISQNWALTAAHCFPHGTNDYNIRVGSTNHKYGGKVHEIHTIVINEQYMSETNDYDMALIKVRKPFHINTKNIKAVKLPRQGEMPKIGSKVTVTGWGRLKEQGLVPSRLQEVIVPIITRKQCQQLYKRYMITERMLCAGYDQGKKDACQGDSGGPLVLNDVLYGLVSWGIGCAQPKMPGVYTNVGSLRSWIKKKSGV